MEGNKCESCGKGTMVKRTGKLGDFLGCDTYPDCKHTEGIESKGSASANAERDITFCDALRKWMDSQ